MQGFSITKTFDSCQKTWTSVKKGDIGWGDAARLGQCHKPLVEVKFFAILHWKLRSFDFILQVYYRLIAGVKLWGKSNKRLLGFVTAAKQEAIDHLRTTTGMLIDTPTSGGGNTNNGVRAERFLQLENRKEICSLIPDSDDKQNFSILLRDVNIMLRITQGTREDVDTTKVKQLGIDIMSHIRMSFLDTNGQPWVAINPSMHSMCAHAWQLFDICSGPLAQYSGQSQEHWNKYITRFKSGSGARARQHGVSVNLGDIFGRMLMMTHPSIASQKRQIICGKCQQVGHSAKSKAYHSYGPANEEEALINKYFTT